MWLNTKQSVKFQIHSNYRPERINSKIIQPSIQSQTYSLPRPAACEKLYVHAVHRDYQNVKIKSSYGETTPSACEEL
jgi:hypothetical protein